MPWSRVLAAGSAAGLAALAGRYAAGAARADRPVQIEARLSDLGEVDEVSVLPLVERLIPEGSGLAGEPGVSYLIRAGTIRVLFDSGLSGGKPRSALARNAAMLGAGLGDLDAVVISHLHADHVGGLRAMRRRTFAFAAEPLEPRGVPAYVPTQVLVVNVRGFDLVLISGCGHPRIEQILAVTEQVLDVPIRAVVGGLHLPVHAARTPLVPQAVLGNPHPPWQPISERDAEHVLAEIEVRGPRIVALSGHDSTPWTYDAFRRRFGDRYRTLRAGEELRITAADR
jgi:7,8-dihydropterin-6-yl-methyl-4-(beta-D-ribofuranosyl)aminobenzene 5'-phosphate synthase